MAKAWGHSRSGIEGLRPHLISAQAGGQRLQPLFRIVSQASIALCRSIRRRVIGTGGRVGSQLEVRTQNNTLCNRSKEF